VRSTVLMHCVYNVGGWAAEGCRWLVCTSNIGYLGSIKPFSYSKYNKALILPYIKANTISALNIIKLLSITNIKTSFYTIYLIILV
jgi:hypothetical protein